jgi:hypothetical protein
MLSRPLDTEVPAFFRGYVDAVPESTRFGEVLASQLLSFPALLRRFPEARTLTGYAPGKWSLKQMAEHINDAERIFTYRLLRIARGDQTPLPGFEQDDYVANSWANSRAWGRLIEEFETVRRSTLALVESLPAEAWTRTGTSSGAHVSARVFVYVMAGHVIHHTRVIQSRYAALLE